MVDDLKDIRTLKILSIAAFALIILSLLVILKVPTAEGYEMSVYAVYPFYFWFFLILSTFIGILILIKSFTLNLKSKHWILGFLAILLVDLILLTMPIIRNYYIYGRGDTLTHVGWITTILTTGSIGSDIYPLDHILGTAVHLLTGLSVENVIKIIPTLFSMFYILSFYCLYNETFEKKSNTILALAFTSILTLGTIYIAFAPFNQAVLTLPFFLYVYFKWQNSSFKLKFEFLLILVSVFVLFFHPLTALMLISLVLIIEFSRYLKGTTKSSSKSRKFFPYILILITLLGFLLWKPYIYMLSNSFGIISYLFIAGNSINSQNIAGIVGKSNIFDLLINALVIYGKYIILSVLSLISIYLITERDIKSYHISNVKLIDVWSTFSDLKFYSIFASVGFLFFSIASFFVFLFVPLFGQERTFSLSVMFASFLVFSFLYEISKGKSRFSVVKRNKTMFMSVILLPIIFLSIFTLYYSPIIKNTNEQVTLADVNGMQTFFNKQDNQTTTLDYGLSQYRFSSMFYGVKTDKYGNDLTLKKVTTPIDNFGYKNDTSLSEYYNSSVYFLVNDAGKELYPSLYPGYEDKWRFSPQDFVKLNLDNTVQLVYTNGQFEVYKTIK